MDVNGTRFHLVLGKRDWLPEPAAPTPGEKPSSPTAEWNDATESVGLFELPAIFPRRKHETPPDPADRRGAGRDRHGNWYWIGDDGRGIVARSPRDAAPVPFWPHPAAEPADCSVDAGGDFAPAVPPKPVVPPRLQGLAVTTEHYLVAGNLDEPGLLVFDLAAGGPPVALRWPEGVPFVPWDICAAPDGGVWLLDRAHACLWSLDRLFRVREAAPSPLVYREPDFAPADPPADGGEEDELFREGPVTLQAAVPLPGIPDPRAVEVLCDGSAIVAGADQHGPVLHRVTLAAGETAAYPLADTLGEYPDVLQVLPYANEIAFVPADGCSADAMVGTVYVVAPDGNQSFGFTLSGPVDALKVHFDRRFLPMRRYGGRALVAAAGEAHYDSGDRWVSLLEYPRPHFAREAVLTLPVRHAGDVDEDGAARPAAFDGREPGCVWHRLFLDACIPPDASVTVESRAADTLAELATLGWSPEPAPYLRANGPELPYKVTFPPGPEGQAGSWELLFQNAVGRYLQLRVTLKGNGRITPRVRALRAYYPRFSYLKEYLPAVYREDAGSAWFLDRYLSNVEGTFTEVEGRIAAAQVLFDTETVPPEFLDWLAGWLGAALDTSWSEQKKRFFLANAMTMFAGRGTRDGLVRALRLALEDCVDPHLFDAAADGAKPVAATSSPSPASTSTAVATTTAKAGGCGCGGAASGPATSSSTENGGARFTVRVVERFLTRDAPGVAYGDVGDLAGPGTTTTALAWTPGQGPGALHARWRGWLASRYGDIDDLKTAWGIAASTSRQQALPGGKSGGKDGGTTKILREQVEAAFGISAEQATMVEAGPDYDSFGDPRLVLPPTAPANAAMAADWRLFLREGLGFTYAAPDAGADLALWRDYLARRYRQPVDLNRAWAVAKEDRVASFDDVRYPAALPTQRAALADWITFVSVVVPMRRGAHRFTVLVPVAPGDDREAQRRRGELARRIALLEKPAHTVVDTRLYWAAFRVGEARLGTDTVLGQGSRFTALVLDRGELAASHLGWIEPWNVRGRLVVGRDPVAARPQSRGTSQRWT